MSAEKGYKYIKYNDFWQDSFQRLEVLTRDIEQDFSTLEKKYVDFDKVYSNIITEINILSSIYSSHNNIKGREYILKLKAVLNTYKKRYSLEGIDFKTIHFLNTKINKLREMSFEDFPKMNHTYVIQQDIAEETADGDIDGNIMRYAALKSSSRYKWITFERSGSCFIAPYNIISIIKQENADTENPDSKTSVKYKDKFIHVTDIFSHFLKNRKDESTRTIKYYIITETESIIKAFAAERLNKILMSDSDFVTQRLKPFTSSRISSGRLRLFGKNHIHLSSNI